MQESVDNRFKPYCMQECVVTNIKHTVYAGMCGNTGLKHIYVRMYSNTGVTQIVYRDVS